MKLPYSYFDKFLEAISKYPIWANRLTLDNNDVDIIHDIDGLLSADPHFIPRL